MKNTFFKASGRNLLTCAICALMAMPASSQQALSLKDYEYLKSATPFPKCYLHKEKWTFDS